MYIYKIENKVNGKCYVGQSTKKIRESEDYYGSGILIKKSIQKYGKDVFEKKILCQCDSKKELDYKEVFFIEKYNTKENGYNIADGGNGGDLGKKVNEKIAKTVSFRWSEGCYDHVDFGKSFRGKHHSNETIEKIRASQVGENGYWFGKEFTEEHKNNISNTVMNVYSDKNGKVYQNYLKGMRDNNVRKKISKALKGREPWNKGKTGVYTDEQIQKMQKSAENRNIDKETEKLRRKKISEYFSENHPNRKIVVDHRNGDKEYDSVKEFCEKTDTSWYFSKRLRKEGKITIL